MFSFFFVLLGFELSCSMLWREVFTPFSQESFVNELLRDSFDAEFLLEIVRVKLEVAAGGLAGSVTG